MAMDDQAFDRLTRLLSSGVSRRSGLRAALGLALAGLPGMEAGAGKRHRRPQKRKKGARRTEAQAVAASCFTGSPCMVGPAKNLANCNLEGSTAFNGANCKGCNVSKGNLRRVDARGVNFTNANLSSACLVGADLSGGTLKNANMNGTVFCRTMMPDGSTNNSGCGKATACCPTCVELGGVCSAGAGGSCCSGAGCVSGHCACPAAKPDVCNGGCTDLQTDRTNCGACGQRCASGETCVAGECVCGAGKSICRDRCVSGTCCNGGAGVNCGSGTTCCSPDGCKDLSDDADNCGACGATCDPTLSNTCVAGVCKCGEDPLCTGGQLCNGSGCSCPAGYAFCEGSCRPTSGDPCGDCGTSCPAGEDCDEGKCLCGDSESCPSDQFCNEGVCACLDDGAEVCNDVCTVCPATPKDAEGDSEKGFCCEGSYCSCNGECCKNDCFWVWDRDDQVVAEFCCEASGGIVCGDQCCKTGTDCLTGCIQMNPRGGSFRRPGG
jgi:hypothetical protein